MESVQISNFRGPVLMNRRNEMGGVRVERMQHLCSYRRWGATRGNQNGGTPVLQLPDDKGRRRGGEKPGRWSPGGWRWEGGSGIFLLQARRGG